MHCTISSAVDGTEQRTCVHCPLPLSQFFPSCHLKSYSVTHWWRQTQHLGSFAARPKSPSSGAVVAFYNVRYHARASACTTDLSFAPLQPSHGAISHVQLCSCPPSLKADGPAKIKTTLIHVGRVAKQKHTPFAQLVLLQRWDSGQAGETARHFHWAAHLRRERHILGYLINHD